MKKRSLLIDLAATTLCLSISLFCLINCGDNYFLMFLHPLLFLVFYYVTYRSIFFSRRSVFKFALGIAVFVRYVIMPLLVGVVGYSTWCQNIPSSSDYLVAQLLMIGEILMITLVFSISGRREKVPDEKKVIIDNRPDFIIIVFTILSFILFFALKNKYGINLHIITPNDDTLLINESSIKQILIMLFNIGKTFLFLFVLKKVCAKEKKTVFDILLVVLFGAFNVLVYTGTNRMQFIISFLCSVYLIVAVFPKLKRKMLIITLLSLVMIIPAISSFRKSELLTVDSTVNNYSQLANAYLGGVDNVAISVETSREFPQYRRFDNFLYDMFRGVLGLNMFLKGENNSNLMSSELYNYVYFGHKDNASQIIPVVGQGYYYFGIMGFWLIEFVFLVLGIKLEGIFKRTTNIYYKYTILLILLRFSIMQGLSGTILAHSISFDCFVPWAIIVLNDVFTNKKRIGYEKEHC
ncbi:hypothetical protein J5491_01920 [Candidatus Saccharibacteria bacterium]|nr:hypothetical protein [Candidatus Saccharibacteria bacterium]